MGDGTAPTRFDSKGKGKAPQNGDILALDLSSAEEGSSQNGGAFMQMQLVEQQVCLVITRDRKGDNMLNFWPIVGHIYTIPFDGYRIHRKHHCRAWADIHATREHGGGTARDGATYRCGHIGHCIECGRGSEGAPEILC